MEKYQYVGEQTRTRGDYGETVEFGYDRGDGCISVFDATFGWQVWASIESCLASGDWVKANKEE